MSNEVIDLPEFLDRVQDDKELLLELLDIFVGDYQQKRLQLTDAAEKGDVEKIKNIAHSLKGSSGNISAKSMRQSFVEIEEKIKENKMNDVKGILKTLDKQFPLLQQRIEQLKVELKPS